jgi:hypothetical protein
MTAANVATRPSVGRSFGSGPVGAIALTFGLVAGLAVGALALRPAATTAPAAAPAVAQTTHQANVGPKAAAAAARAAAAKSERALVNYTQVVANVQAAESRHDFAAKFRFERQLRAMLTPQTIGLVYQERSHLMDSLAEAKATGNGYGIWRIKQELDALCGPAAVKAQLSFC